MSVQEYLCKMKDIFDTLVANGQSLSEKDLIHFILDGLSTKFEPMVVHIIARMESSTKKLNLPKIKFILQKYE